VRPDPQLALDVLNDPQIKTILPPICQRTVPTKAGRFAGATQWLLEHSIGILVTGLILFAGLCGWGLVRGALGLSEGNPAGALALLAGMVALALVWSNDTVSRESVEYQLQAQMAENFKAAGNLKRAAIHEQRAEQLKQFAN
jgi:hypothetical protein